MTRPGDLTFHGLGLTLHKRCGKDGDKVGENLPALSAAVFAILRKPGGVQADPPPPPLRLERRDHLEFFEWQ